MDGVGVIEMDGLYGEPIMERGHIKFYLLPAAVIAALLALVFGLSFMPNLSSDHLLRGAPPDLRNVAPQELIKQRLTVRPR